MPFDISSQSPANGATNVYLNSNIQVTFSGALLASSVTEETVVLTDLQSNRSVIGAVSYDSTTKTVYFNPENYLSPSTNYRYSLVGSDYAIGTPLTDATGLALTGTLDYTFTAGTEIDHRDEERHKNSLTETLEGDLELPSNIAVIASQFTVENASPKPMVADVEETTSQFSIEFSKTLSTGDFSQDWVEINYYPLMDDEDYVAKTISGETIFRKDATIVQVSGYFEDIDYSAEVSGKYLLINLSGELRRNELVEVVLDKDIKSDAGDTLANSDVIWEFSTQLYPDIAGVRSVKREISTISSDFKDSYISALIHKNTFMGYEMSKSSTALAKSNKTLRNYVKWATIVDILEDKDVEKSLEAGIRRQIGDYSVSVDANVIGRVSVKLAQSMKKMERSLDSLQKESGVRVLSTSFLYNGVMPNRMWDCSERVSYWRYKSRRSSEVPDNADLVSYTRFLDYNLSNNSMNIMIL